MSSPEKIKNLQINKNNGRAKKYRRCNRRNK